MIPDTRIWIIDNHNKTVMKEEVHAGGAGRDNDVTMKLENEFLAYFPISEVYQIILLSILIL